MTRACAATVVAIVLAISVPGYASSITYQGGGMLHQVQHTNGVTYTVEREPASAIDRPHRISTNRGLDTGIYAYDGAGNVKQIGTQDFRYDRFKRMTSGEVTISGQDRIQSATYDVYNNLLSLTTNGSTLTTSVNASTNRLTSVSALYDAAGNLTRQVRGSETHQYTYDPLGMPKYLQSTTDQAQVQLYDADDERLATYDCFPGVCDSPGWELRTTVRGLGGEPLREYSTRGTNGWQWVRDYVYRNGGMLAAAEPDGNGGENVYHFHPDHLGTPRQITNASGVQVALHSYYPFGQEATDPAQTSFTKKFTGHERDTNGTGTAGDLDYMHARYCSPTLGRFLSFDPIGGNPRAPQSWNRYAYALNSPMNYTDPEGLFAQLFLDLYFVVFDEITVTGSSYSSLVGYFYRLAYYFSEGVRPSIYGELGRPTPPAAGVSRALLEGDELERVRFGMSHGAIDTGGVPEFLIFLPMGRLSGLARASRSAVPRINLANPRVTSPVDLLKPAGRAVGNPGTSTRIRLLAGGEAEASAFFNNLARGGKVIENSRFPGTLVEMPGGARIGFRPVSKSGPPTIDVFIKEVGIREIKFIP
ncbi:MAG: hypothetical protein HC897_01345 [Thermoanaerobaculia bacterium]|nr:hypothetical protein [Thermoanaerobaculia bacterium]